MSQVRAQMRVKLETAAVKMSWAALVLAVTAVNLVRRHSGFVLPVPPLFVFLQSFYPPICYFHWLHWPCSFVWGNHFLQFKTSLENERSAWSLPCLEYRIPIVLVLLRTEH